MKEKDNVIWRTKNSLWIGLSFIPGLTWLAFLWIGLRVKAAKWVFTSVLYVGAVGSGFWLLFGSRSPLDFLWKLVLFILIEVVVWLVGIVHAFICRDEYLRRYAMICEGNDEAARESDRREIFGLNSGTSGDSATPQRLALEAGYKMMTEMYKMYQEMPDECLKDEMADIYGTAEKIYKHVSLNPESAVKIRKFNEYYFPEVLKMLRSYEEMLKISESPETGEKIESLLKGMVVAFQNQLDHLISDKKLDIHTDIDVLQQMAKRDGLDKDGTLGGN